MQKVGPGKFPRVKFKSACAGEADFEAARGAPRQAPASQRAGLASDPPCLPPQGWEMGIVFKLKNYLLKELTPLPPPFFCSQLSPSSLCLLFLCFFLLAEKEPAGLSSNPRTGRVTLGQGGSPFWTLAVYQKRDGNRAQEAETP